MAWGQDKAEFIRRRDQLLELASHGETDVYKAIVADWVTVWPAGTTMGRPGPAYPAIDYVFETVEKEERLRQLGRLGWLVYRALENTHAKFISMKLGFEESKRITGDAARGCPSNRSPLAEPDYGLDLSGLTDKEKAYLKL